MDLNVPRNTQLHAKGKETQDRRRHAHVRVSVRARQSNLT